MEFLRWFFVGGVTSHTYGFCIPLDFIGIKDLGKIKKRPRKFSKAIAKAMLAFFIFLRSLTPKKSSGIKNSYV